MVNVNVVFTTTHRRFQSFKFNVFSRCQCVTRFTGSHKLHVNGTFSKSTDHGDEVRSKGEDHNLPITSLVLYR